MPARRTDTTRGTGLTALCFASCGLFALTVGWPLSSGEGPDPVHRVRRPIPGRYLVILHGNDDPEAVSRETAAIFQGRIGHVYRRTIRGFAVQLADAAARALARDPRVAFVEEDGVVSATSVQRWPPSWGLDRIDQRLLPLDERYRYPRLAQPVNVYVIDSGIRVTHDEFGGRAFIGADFVDDDGDGDLDDIGNDDADPRQPDGVDCYGHGTAVAGVIGGAEAGVAKNATLWSYRVFGCDGTGTWSSVIAAVDAITADARRPALVNVSLGGERSTATNAAIQRAIASGLTYIVAAGNRNDDAANYSPSSVAEAIVVGASTIDDRRQVWSNRGRLVDLFAPGEDIVSAAVYGDSIFGLASGTSLAAPHVAGVAALYLQSHPFASPWQVQDAVTRAATRNRIRDAGRDSPNRLLYSGFLRGAEPRITVTAPNGAVDWGRGSQQQIEWTHNLGAGSYVRVLISRDGGATYTLIAGRVRNASATVGRLMWTVTGPNTTAARVQVEAIAAAAHGASNKPFVVADPYITITAPNGGDVWTVGSWAQIQWTHNLGRLDRVNVTFSKNGGSRYQTIVSNTPCDGAEAVVVRPSFSSRRARVGVSWARDMAISDVSDATFVVRHPRSQRSITQDSAVR